MSLVADQLDTPVVFKLPPIFKSLPQTSRDFCGNSECSLNFSNNSASKFGSTLKYQLNYGLKVNSEFRETPRSGSRISNSGINYLKSLPFVLARQKDALRMEEDLAKRRTFPEEASVSLPTSTTTLEYLLYRRNSRISAADEKGGEREAIKVNRYGSANIIKMGSTSDINSLISRANSDHTMRQLYQAEPCIYTHKMFERAATILNSLKHSEVARNNLSMTMKKRTQTAEDNDDILMMVHEDPQEQIKTFELTLAALKFQKLFEATLEGTDFFTEHSNLKNHSSLVCVVLYDVHNRKFQRRTTFQDEQVNVLCNEIEDALISKKTRLQSFIAKERIKNNAPAIEYLLPESIRQIDKVKSKIPIYMWVNQLKTTMEDVCAELEADGFIKLAGGNHVTEHDGKVYKKDTHCCDLLVFPSALSLYFKSTKLVKMGHLIQQDKSSCLAAESVQYLLGSDKDVIHINVGTGVTTAHLLSLLKKKSPHSHIWGFGLGSLGKARRTMKNIEFLGAIKNTRLLTDDFLSIDPEEPKLKSAKVILITANCSKSAITNPIEFLISEGEDMNFLGDIFKASRSMDNVNNLVMEHERILKHALMFPRVHAVVYATRSRYECENELVVKKALEYVHATSTGKGVPFRVTPPVLPFTFDEIDSGASGIVDRFIKFLPSVKSNGYFVSVISREPEDHKNTAKSSIPIARSNIQVGKAKSAPHASGEEYSGTSNTSRKGLKNSKSKKMLKGVVSAPEAQVGITSKLAGHKSPAAFGARLYQVGLVHKMEQRAKQTLNKNEYIKVIKPQIISSGYAGYPGVEFISTE